MKEQPKSRVHIDEQGTNLMDVVIAYQAGHPSEAILKNFKISRVSGEPPKPDRPIEDAKSMLDRFRDKHYRESRNMGGSFNGLDRIPFVVDKAIVELMKCYAAQFSKVSGEAKTPGAFEVKNSMRRTYLEEKRIEEIADSYNSVAAAAIDDPKSFKDGFITGYNVRTSEAPEELMAEFMKIGYQHCLDDLENDAKELTGGSVPTPSDEDVSKAALTYQGMIGGNRSDACSFTEGVTWVKEWLRGSTEQEKPKAYVLSDQEIEAFADDCVKIAAPESLFKDSFRTNLISGAKWARAKCLSTTKINS